MGHNLYRDLSLIVIKLHYLAAKAHLPSLASGLRRIADELSDLIKEKVEPNDRYK